MIPCRIKKTGEAVGHRFNINVIRIIVCIFQYHLCTILYAWNSRDVDLPQALVELSNLEL